MDNDQLTRIENKIDRVENHQAKMNVTLAGQAVQLKEHIRRTTLLEQAVKPLTARYEMVNGVLRLIGLVSLLVGIAEGVATVLAYLRS